MARYPKMWMRNAFQSGTGPAIRALHSSTFRLNVSALCWVGDAFKGCLGGVWEASEGSRGRLGCPSCQKRLRSS